MVKPSTDRSPYVVLAVHEEYVTAYLHTVTGSGKSARRTLRHVVHCPNGPLWTLTDVLRAVADQIDSPPSDRWQPRP